MFLASFPSCFSEEGNQVFSRRNIVNSAVWARSLNITRNLEFPGLKGRSFATLESFAQFKFSNYLLSFLDLPVPCLLLENLFLSSLSPSSLPLSLSLSVSPFPSFSLSIYLYTVEIDNQSVKVVPSGAIKTDRARNIARTSRVPLCNATFSVT